MSDLVSFYQGALAGEAKRLVFQIPCEMQRSLDLLCPDYTKERTSEKEAIVLRFGATVRQNENGIRAYSGGFLHASMHSTLQCARLGRFVFPAKAKAPWFLQFSI